YVRAGPAAVPAPRRAVRLVAEAGKFAWKAPLWANSASGKVGRPRQFGPRRGPPAAVPWPGRPTPARSPARRSPPKRRAPGAPTPPTDAGPEPYTLQWFLDIEHQRHGREGRWLPRLLEFAKHRGDTLLGLGDGLGTDWLQYARHGASVIVCSRTAAQLALVR